MENADQGKTEKICVQVEQFNSGGENRKGSVLSFLFYSRAT